MLRLSLSSSQSGSLYRCTVRDTSVLTGDVGCLGNGWEGDHTYGSVAGRPPRGRDVQAEI